MKKDALTYLCESLTSRPRLLLHVCCAPCSSAVLERLCPYFDITVSYYNPNISPKEEYEYRAEELMRLLREMPSAKGVQADIPAWDEEPFLRMAQGLETLPEGGERCFRCYEMRLRDTAQKARAEHYDYFCTTLSISPYKNASKLNEIGSRLADEYGVKYLTSDFKKQNGYLHSIQLSKVYHLYRQPYCGCKYSRQLWEQRTAEKDHSQNQSLTKD